MEGHTKCKDLESYGDSENADHHAKKKKKKKTLTKIIAPVITQKRKTLEEFRGYLLLTTGDKFLIHKKANGKKQDAHCT